MKVTGFLQEKERGRRNDYYYITICTYFLRTEGFTGIFLTPIFLFARKSGISSSNRNNFMPCSVAGSYRPGSWIFRHAAVHILSTLSANFRPCEK